MPAQLSFAKVTATPNKSSWCLSYNAGNLFAAVSITSESDSHPPSEIGKTFINNLEAEFFSLEEKSYKSIKEAITTACSELPKEAHVSAAFAYHKDGALYVYAREGAVVLLSRGEQQGALVTGEEQEIIGASGILQAQDTVVVGTKEFFEAVPPSALTQALSLQLPSDMVENLTLPLQEKESGAEAGLFLKFSGEAQLAPKEVSSETPTPVQLAPTPSAVRLTPSQEMRQQEKEDEEEFFPSRTVIPSDTSEKAEKVPFTHNLTSFLPFLLKARFLYIGLALLVFFAIIGLIYQTKTRQYNTEVKAVYEKAYEAASKDVEEAESLLTLNKTLARDGFLAAKERLEEITPKLKKDSPEEKQAQELLAKIDSYLSETSDQTALTPSEEELSSNDFLQTVQKEDSAISYAQDAGFVYVLTSSEISKIDKNNGKKTSLVKKSDSWSSPVAISVYLGNIYLLDRENGVLKYTAGSSGFGESSYFQEDQDPPLSALTSLTIDGSIWLLAKDGEVYKYTKGTKDSFSISGLSKLPTNPRLIHTTVEGDTLYILDPQNSQFILINKSGSFITSLQAEEIKQTREFVIDEKEKKIFFLSGDKMYSIPLP